MILVLSKMATVGHLANGVTKDIETTKPEGWDIPEQHMHGERT